MFQNTYMLKFYTYDIRLNSSDLHNSETINWVQDLDLTYSYLNVKIKIPHISVWHFLMNLKNNYLSKNKYIKKHNHMSHGSWDMKWDNFLSSWAIFALLSPNNLENQNFEKMKKASGDVIILHKCNKTHNHIMYASWNMEWDRHDFLSFRVIFCPFTPMLT